MQGLARSFILTRIRLGSESVKAKEVIGSFFASAESKRVKAAPGGGNCWEFAEKRLGTL